MGQKLYGPDCGICHHGGYGLPGQGTGRVADLLTASQTQGKYVQDFTAQLTGKDPASAVSGSATAALPGTETSQPVTGGAAAQDLAQKITVSQTAPTDTVTGLPKLQFLSNDTALRTGTVGGVSDTSASTLSLPSNTSLQTAATSSSVTQSAVALTPMARSAVTGGSYTYDPSNNYFSGNYDVSAYGNIDNATTSNWSWSGNGGAVGGFGLTPGEAARLATNVWENNAANYGQSILGRALSPDEVHAYRDVIHGKVKSHGKSPADAIYSQLYKIASSEEAARYRNEISFSLTGQLLSTQEQVNWAKRIAEGSSNSNTLRSEKAHTNAAANKIYGTYHDAGGVTANRDQITSWQDALGRGDTTIDKIRGIIASREGNDAVRYFYPTILDRAASDQEIANSQNALAQGKSLNDIRNDIVRSSEAQGHVDTFLTKTFGQASDDLRSAGTMALSNLSQAYQAFRNYSSDELHSLANGFQATVNAGNNILQSLLPNTPQGWLELGAMIAIDLTPPGEAVAAGEMLTLGGEKLLEKGLTILESRFISDMETKSIQIISKGGSSEEVKNS